MRPAEGEYQPDMNLVLDDPSIAVRVAATYVDIEGREFRTSSLVGGAAKPPFIRDESV